MSINYEYIKQLARETGARVTDLIPLAPQNDPFYTGTPNDWALGEWFAHLWQAFGYTTKVHIRRVHYQIISQRPAVLLPNGKPYENTEECWGVLNLASKAARYLRLVDPAAFDDRRNPDPLTYADYQVYEPGVSTSLRLWAGDLRLPAFPDLPDYYVRDFKGTQRYHLEVWCEKSTMNDVLGPLCQAFRANLQTGLGELSITATLALVHRLQQAGKPARIFYVSDFDPAGQSMPVAVSRKIEYFVRTFGLDLDVRLFPVVLTQEQVASYQLPRTPIKDTERRRVGFEDRYGQGAVELDALEALYPGELQQVLSAYMNPYYDYALDARVGEVAQQLEEDLEALRQQVIARYTGNIQAVQAEYAQLKADFSGRMERYSQQLKGLWQAMRQELDLSIPDLSSYAVPEPVIAEEIGEGLYNSERDYLEQIESYKQFQGKLVVAE
ncbi:MAG TPA: hypothetical protein VGT44_10385 [Ktedonobacteraceae bacterium]|nr:hypothetical protein [Ktedonobacteraceae bacterium]